ncbi:MAG: oligosaccharide flippase family protein [Flavobacteriales bacterium]|jgi:O-antigen/teichoic acid export membrane protein|nr:oligosaccharide flippase family protein [Flavobacteriales bacterium]
MKFINDSYIKNVGILFSGNVFAQLIPLALAPIITRLFSPEELGIQGNFIALATLISIVANGRLELAIVLPKKTQEAIQLLKVGLKISIIVSLLMLALPLLGSIVEDFYKTNYLQRFLPLISITVLTISSHNLLIQWLVRSQRFRTISTIKVLLSLSTNVLFILYGWLNYKAEGLIYGYLLGFIFSTIVLFFIIQRGINWKATTSMSTLTLIKKYKDFPLINSLHAFSDILFSEFIILIIITHHFGIATTGIYVIMVKYLKAPTRFIGSAIGQVFYAEANIAFQQQKNTTPYLSKSILIALIVALPLVLFILLLGPQLFEWYLGEAWSKVGVYAKYLILPIALGLISSPISSIPLIYNQQKKSFVINLIGMTLSALTFYIAAASFSSITIALLAFSIPQTILYLYLLIWYYQLSKT